MRFLYKFKWPNYRRKFLPILHFMCSGFVQVLCLRRKNNRSHFSEIANSFTKWPTFPQGDSPLPSCLGQLCRPVLRQLCRPVLRQLCRPVLGQLCRRGLGLLCRSCADLCWDSCADLCWDSCACSCVVNGVGSGLSSLVPPRAQGLGLKP